MDRRTFLAASGVSAAVALAGCSGSGNPQAQKAINSYTAGVRTFNTAEGQSPSDSNGRWKVAGMYEAAEAEFANSKSYAKASDAISYAKESEEKAKFMKRAAEATAKGTGYEQTQKSVRATSAANQRRMRSIDVFSSAVNTGLI